MGLFDIFAKSTIIGAVVGVPSIKDLSSRVKEDNDKKKKKTNKED